MAYDEKPTIWNSFPKLVEELKRCISEKFSARQTADKLSEISPTPVNRNQVIGKAARIGLKFDGGKVMPRTEARPIRRKAEVGLRTSLFQEKAPPLPLPETNDPLKFDESIPLAQRKTIMELDPHDCRYIIGEGPNRFYCGGAAILGTSWCENHYWRCFAPKLPRSPSKSLW